MSQYVIAGLNLEAAILNSVTEIVKSISGKDVESRLSTGGSHQTVEELIGTTQTASDKSQSPSEKAQEPVCEKALLEIPVIMFHGFRGGQVSFLLSQIPAEIKTLKPIFCTTTESNLQWPVNELMEHLLEERKHWESKSQEQ